MATKTQEDLAQIAHLLRRTGFGPTYDEIEAYAAKGYQAAVEELLQPENQPALDEAMLLRTNIAWSKGGPPGVAKTYWMYKVIRSQVRLLRGPARTVQSSQQCLRGQGWRYLRGRLV